MTTELKPKTGQAKSVLDVFEKYQRERVHFVQTVASLAQRAQVRPHRFAWAHRARGEAGSRGAGWRPRLREAEPRRGARPPARGG